MFELSSFAWKKLINRLQKLGSCVKFKYNYINETSKIKSKEKICHCKFLSMCLDDSTPSTPITPVPGGGAPYEGTFIHKKRRLLQSLHQEDASGSDSDMSESKVKAVEGENWLLFC